ncbi:MAG: hypothetical protein AABW73_02035 [Nanoarchaeota archaeon]
MENIQVSVSRQDFEGDKIPIWYKGDLIEGAISITPEQSYSKTNNKGKNFTKEGKATYQIRGLLKYKANNCFVIDFGVLGVSTSPIPEQISPQISVGEHINGKFRLSISCLMEKMERLGRESSQKLIQKFRIEKIYSPTGAEINEIKGGMQGASGIIIELNALKF